MRGDRGYRLIAEIGRGGMGSVWLAERADGEYRQRVAIKLVHGGPGALHQLLLRFRTERQILASLDHPNVARLLDGGTTADGVPFLVMEYVEGERIDDYCERLALGTEARLRLVLKVCDAVSAAHQRLVVHRDLKPANILVTAAGDPKLLDFGIAKLLEPGAAGATVAETATGVSPLTPRYASPEQVRGEPVTTASDVYSLGVVLYELLAGRSPYADENLSPHLLPRAICEEEPTPPSSRPRGDDATTAAARSQRPPLRIDRDLDAVVLKALRKEAGARYASVEALADDIERYLDGRPVTARRGTLPYRTLKLLRRHRWAAVAAALLVTLLAGWGLSLDRQLERTRIERDNARAVTDFLVEVFKVADPERASGTEPNARDILDHGAARAAEMLEGKPEILGRVLQAIGRVYQNLGAPDRAAAELERALELRGGDRERDPVGYASVLVDLGSVLRELNRFERAEALYEEALSLLRAAPRPAAEAIRTARNGLASVKVERGDLAGAEPIFRELVEAELASRGLAEPPGEQGPPLGDEFRTLGIQLHNLGAMNLELGRYDEAVRFLRHGLAVKSRLATPAPASVATTLEALGNVENQRQRYAESLELQERALALRSGIYEAGHPLIAQSLLNRASALDGLARHEEALADYRRAREIWEAAYGREHDYVAMAYNNEANAEWALGDLVAAEERHRTALAIREEVLGPEHPETAMSLQNLAGVLGAQGRFREAIALDRRATELSIRILGPTHPDTLDRRLALAKDLLALGEAAAATAELEAILDPLESGDRVNSRADARFALARALIESGGDRARALDLARDALEALRGRTGLAGTTTAEEVEAWLRLTAPPGIDSGGRGV